MERGLGSREQSTGFLGVEYPNLLFNVDPTSQRVGRNVRATRTGGNLKSVKS